MMCTVEFFVFATQVVEMQHMSIFKKHNTVARWFGYAKNRMHFGGELDTDKFCHLTAVGFS